MPENPLRRLVLITGDTACNTEGTATQANLFAKLGWTAISGKPIIRNLPFSLGDSTAGSETELQVAVEGSRSNVDLPTEIEQSEYFANLAKRAASGDTPRSLISDLENFISCNTSDVWENSWVRFPKKRLSKYAQEIFEQDMLMDRANPASGRRSDSHRFIIKKGNMDEQIRIPVSYLLKLALSDCLGTGNKLPPELKETGEALLAHFLNDNTSPETFSFHVVPMSDDRSKCNPLARETAKRFLFTQLLVMYANDRFGLKESGQKALIYFAPHPPMRQKELNSLISDSFYRELFMSPCLSGWDRGEEKHRYMHLCHQVLSRSQLNAVAKLREAGIITNNLVVLPNLSNVSLANNGTHVSLGSRKLGELLADERSGFTGTHEKKLGDLTIKIMEHFLPLFVGTYSAAPYRLAFNDFHPENALGFLPHELDYTHLRMIWRRWKKKASLSIFGQPVTPFGPHWIDRTVSSVFGLKGDFVPDFRLIDYLVGLLSTPQSPALDGRMGNSSKLKKDLAELGIFDAEMSLYLPCKLREFSQIGFSGFEGRYYSQFPSMVDDIGKAVDLQLLLTSFAYKLIIQGEINHASIPDDPSIESERRQIFFASAIGLPTFFVKRNTGNSFLRKVLEKTHGTRPSKRYQGYVRVPLDKFRIALLELVKEEAADLIEMFGMEDVLKDLSERLSISSGHSASSRLTKGILEEIGTSDSLKVDAKHFNKSAESYYRNSLRIKHIEEAINLLEDDCAELDRVAAEGDSLFRAVVSSLPGASGARNFLAAIRSDLLLEKLDSGTVRQLINLMLLSIRHDSEEAKKQTGKERENVLTSSSIHRA